jgi:hypothetical protein
MWNGMFPTFNGLDLIGGGGIITADGRAWFWAGGSDLETGTVFAAPDGRVDSQFTRYLRLPATLAAPPSSSRLQSLSFNKAVQNGSLTGMFRDMFSSKCTQLVLGYHGAYKNHVPTADVAGVYSVSEDSGYTFTIAIDALGVLTGSDTNGCVLLGAVAPSSPARLYFEADIDVSSCGGSSGHYAGIVLPYLSSGGAVDTVFLAVSNPSMAVFRSLAR